MATPTPTGPAERLVSLHDVLEARYLGGHSAWLGLRDGTSGGYHGTVALDPARVTDEVIAHLVGLVKAHVRVTLDIEARLPDGVPENVVRTVTENRRTLRFDSQVFEAE